MTAAAATTRKPKKSDLVKPSDLSNEAWLFRLECDKRDLSAQIRREVHTRGFVHGKYMDRLDRAIWFARAAITPTTEPTL